MSQFRKEYNKEKLLRWRNTYEELLQQLILDLYPAKAAYSLSKLSATYSGAAINVRRSSDNATLDIGFNGTDLDIAALEAFCQPNVVVYQSDFTSGNDNLQEIRGTGTDGETVAGVSDCFKFTIDNQLGSHQAFRSGLEVGQTFTMTFDYYLPSTNTDVTGILVSRTNPGPTTVYDVTDQWTSVSVTLEDDSFFRFFAHNGSTTNFTGNGTDVFYLKNVVITQLTTNGYVTIWYDQSSNGYNETQNTASSQPQIVSAGSVILENGKPTIEAIDIFNALTTPFTSAAQMTTVAVSRLYDISANRYITDSGTGRYIVGAFSGTGKYTAFRSTALSGDTAQTTQASLYFATFDGANSTLTNDSGTTYTGDAGTSSFTELRLMSGLGNGFNGNVQTIIIYDTDQSSNRVAIETALNDYYNIF